ncbi:hemolysin family protein [Brachybacterium sp. p3-SID957]|uniref:hemolysin family protein n=1 Tax=Brachybacterium sp. p3-SID957 TaxID=2916049 RepID=UPI00223AD912|nr:hemolysin family protein [Brachybacterium sp. p3-SID957]MCT1774774.1 hemolysin family protein [Brachybacterium sp. p3-SID957]
MMLAAGILIPVALVGLVIGAVLTAADSALAATTRSALERALEERPEGLRRRVLRQHEDSRRTQLLWPPASALIAVSSVVTPGADREDGPYGVDSELRSSVDRALEKQHLEIVEHDMIQGVFDLRDTIVRELMVPRTDMLAIAAGATAEQAVRLFVRSGFSRIPVVGESVDDVLGMLYVKDVMRAIHSPWDPRPDRAVEDIARRAYFVPEFVSADVVLQQMQTSHVHIAIVVDEYGGVSGIVTIEDVVEEIVGDIEDEHDRSEPQIEDLGDGVFRVPARESVTEVGELFGLDIEDEDVDSIGGLLGKAIGRVPIVGSRGSIHGLQLEGERTTGRRKRLSTLLVSRAAGPGEDDDHPTGGSVAVDPIGPDRPTPQEDPREQ